MFKVVERLGHKDGAGQKHHRERSLEDHQRLLRKRGPVARGTTGSAQHFGGLCVRRNPGGRNSEQHSGHERNQKGETQARRARGWHRWAYCGRLEMQEQGWSASPRRQRPGPPSPRWQLSRTLSVMIWRMTRQRPAPSAMRTATSPRRVVLRASIRLAMLAHAITSTTEERIMSMRQTRASFLLQVLNAAAAGHHGYMLLGDHGRAAMFGVHGARREPLAQRGGELGLQRRDACSGANSSQRIEPV